MSTRSSGSTSSRLRVSYSIIFFPCRWQTIVRSILCNCSALHPVGSVVAICEAVRSSWFAAREAWSTRFVYASFGACILRGGANASATIVHLGGDSEGRSCSIETRIAAADTWRRPCHTGDCATADNEPAASIAHLQRSKHSIVRAVVVQRVLGIGQL